MKCRSNFLKNSEYDKQPSYDEEGNWTKDDIPMYQGIIDIAGKVYDGKIYRRVEYGKEVMVLCLENDEDQSPF